MQNTTNYNLNKPDGNDYARIESLNENADIIDEKLKDLEEGLNNIDFSSVTQAISNVDSRVAAHANLKNNPHEVTAEQIGAVRKNGDSMTGVLTTTAVHLTNGTRFQESPGYRTVINANSNRFDVVSQDGQKTLFRWSTGDFFVFDEDGTTIDSFKSLKQSITNITKLPTPTNLNLATGWENADTANPLRFYKDALGFVHVHGRIKITSTSAPYNFATLPTGYRPLKQTDNVVLAGVSEATSVEVRTDGQIGTVLDKTVGNTVLINISYPTTI